MKGSKIPHFGFAKSNLALAGFLLKASEIVQQPKRFLKQHKKQILEALSIAEEHL